MCETIKLGIILPVRYDSWRRALYVGHVNRCCCHNPHNISNRYQIIDNNNYCKFIFINSLIFINIYRTGITYNQ